MSPGPGNPAATRQQPGKPGTPGTPGNPATRQPTSLEDLGGRESVHLPGNPAPPGKARQPGSNPAVDYKMNNSLISLNSLKPEPSSLNSLSSLLKKNIHWSASQFSFFKFSLHKKEGQT